MIAVAWAVVVSVLRRPGLLPIAVRTGLGLVPTRWWRKWPPLPVPDRHWIAFRLETAYGDPRARPSPEDVSDYLAWARNMRSTRRGVRRR
ncbi:MAG: hypothetical protein WCF24_11135 [Acidimicrobiales bacterium]